MTKDSKEKSSKDKSSKDFAKALRKASAYGMSEFFEIMGEMSQQSTRKGSLDRVTKELITYGIALKKQCERCIHIHSQDASRLGASPAELDQVRKIVLFMQATPSKNHELWHSWTASWEEFSLSKGTLSHSQRELVALAVALVMQHHKQIELHVRDALCYHTRPEAIIEVIPLALLMDGAPVLSQIPYVVNALEQKKS